MSSTNSEQIILYQIGGLGADNRVFQYLKLDNPTKTINWLEPKNNEILTNYVKRISEQIQTNQKFGILGVSFGGVIAIELAKIVQPEIILLVSSVYRDEQLPAKYLNIGRTGILNLIPNFLIKPPRIALKYLFGAENINLLKQIIEDTNPKFIKWALKSIISWKNENTNCSVVRIHGDSDKLIPLKGEAIKIKNGKHFMIVDKADELSEVINRTIQNAV